MDAELQVHIEPVLLVVAAFLGDIEMPGSAAPCRVVDRDLADAPPGAGGGIGPVDLERAEAEVAERLVEAVDLAQVVELLEQRLGRVVVGLRSSSCRVVRTISVPSART